MSKRGPHNGSQYSSISYSIEIYSVKIWVVATASNPGSWMILLGITIQHFPFRPEMWHLPSYFHHLQKSLQFGHVTGPQFQLVQQQTSHYKHLGNSGEPRAIRMVGMKGARSAKITSTSNLTAESCLHYKDHLKSYNRVIPHRCDSFIHGNCESASTQTTHSC